MAQNVIYSPWKITNDPWLCLMTILLFGLLWLFSFVSVLFISLIILRLNFSTDTRQTEEWGIVVGKVHRVLLHFRIFFFFGQLCDPWDCNIFVVPDCNDLSHPRIFKSSSLLRAWDLKRPLYLEARDLGTLYISVIKQFDWLSFHFQTLKFFLVYKLL